MDTPTLIDLHASLANKDHLHVYINTVKFEMFLFGIDWAGIQHYKKIQDATKPTEDHYLRFIGTFSKTDDSPMPLDTKDECICLIVSMFPGSSFRLVHNHYLQSDIAFQSITGYEEFELEGWDEETSISVCYS
ncbi:hypothetical protein M422DRAFT_251830 [Sphaerobolus stellatus SS14]|uniref:Uncharacterized protein n=1 Tax=Sphaerobolus stellatus (strain SS14) TaxID=990650 RepID=A0A0C9W0B5_SPHS4|nr:hypothetical protein M422DRAFT_251830 [Sphaerobolus stellatus SS14]